MSVLKKILALLFVLFLAVTAYGNGFELRRDDFNGTRPIVEQGMVNLNFQEGPPDFPRYLNELGIEKIRIKFRGDGIETKRVSFVWSGGSEGRDRFTVKVDDIFLGFSEIADSEQRPYAWNRDEFLCRLAPGAEHKIEIYSPPGFKNAIEFAGIRLSQPNSKKYQPLCYESVGSLEIYEQQLGAKGALVKTDHI